MNGFIKNNNHFFSLLLGVLLSSSLHAITFRNEPLSNFIETGRVLCATFLENSFAILEMENDNFDIGTGDINEMKHLKETFEEVRDNASRSISSRTCHISSNILNYYLSYFVGHELINIQAKTSLTFTQCLFESPLVNITGNTMNFKDCFFINPQTLNIIVDYPESDYKVIQIIFYDQPENPTVIIGKIDLNNNQTTQRLILSNVKEIRIEFNPQVWNN